MHSKYYTTDTHKHSQYRHITHCHGIFILSSNLIKSLSSSYHTDLATNGKQSYIRSKTITLCIESKTFIHIHCRVYKLYKSSGHTIQCSHFFCVLQPQASRFIKFVDSVFISICNLTARHIRCTICFDDFIAGFPISYF